MNLADQKQRVGYPPPFGSCQEARGFLLFIFSPHDQQGVPGELPRRPSLSTKKLFFGIIGRDVAVDGTGRPLYAPRATLARACTPGATNRPIPQTPVRTFAALDIGPDRRTAYPTWGKRSELDRTCRPGPPGELLRVRSPFYRRAVKHGREEHRTRSRNWAEARTKPCVIGSLRRHSVSAGLWESRLSSV